MLKEEIEEIEKLHKRLDNLEPPKEVVTYKRLKNDFFSWMWDIYEKEDIGHGIRSKEPPNTEDIDAWDMIWEDKSSQRYTYVAYIFWKTTKGKYGYDYYYHDAYDERDMHYSHMFDTLDNMKRDYETEGGYDMPFPERLFE
jgi:hypothetical protein